MGWITLYQTSYFSPTLVISADRSAHDRRQLTCWNPSDKSATWALHIYSPSSANMAPSPWLRPQVFRDQLQQPADCIYVHSDTALAKAQCEYMSGEENGKEALWPVSCSCLSHGWKLNAPHLVPFHHSRKWSSTCFAYFYINQSCQINEELSVTCQSKFTVCFQ